MPTEDIITPDTPDTTDDGDDGLLKPGTKRGRKQTKLATIGMVISERTRLYNRMQNLNMKNPDHRNELVKLKEQDKVLKHIREDHEAALNYHLRADADDDDAPAMTGLRIDGPAPDLPHNVPTRQLIDGRPDETPPQQPNDDETGKGQDDVQRTD